MDKSIHTRAYAVLRRLLRETRRNAGLTQIELAEKIEETQSYVSKIERGELRLDVVQLRTICQALGITLTEFVRRLEGLLPKRH